MIVKRKIVPHIRGKPSYKRIPLFNNRANEINKEGVWPLLSVRREDLITNWTVCLREQTANRREATLLRGWMKALDQANVLCLKKKYQPATRSPRSPNDTYQELQYAALR